MSRRSVPRLRSTLGRLCASAALAFLSLAACCHAPDARPAAPPAFGFFGLVHPHRQVLCVDLTHTQCTAVADAVDKIDTAVGFELLRHPQAATASDPLSLDAEATVVFNDDAPNDEYWGATKPQSVHQPCWLGIVSINFNPLIWQSADLYEAVVLHELVHSVGAAHAPGDGETVFGSVEMPGWRPGRPTELTPEDITALQAAYPHG